MIKINLLALSIFLILSSYVCALELKVGLFHIPPYAENTEEGNKGVLIDFLKEIEAESKLKFSITIYPYPRLISSLKEGIIDIAIFYPNNKAGTNKYMFLETLGNINYIIVNKDVETLEGIQGKRMGIIRGASYGGIIDSHDKKLKVDLKSYSQGLKMIKINRLSSMAIPSTVYSHLCKINDCSSAEHNLFKVNKRSNWVHKSKNVSLEKLELFKKAHDSVLKKRNYKFLHDLL